jgi:hypothetical protein
MMSAMFYIEHGLSQGTIVEFFYGIFVLTSRVLAFYLVTLFKQFFDSVQNQIFTLDNASRLRRISHIVLGLGFFYAIETYPHRMAAQAVELFATQSGTLKHGVFAFIIIGFFIRFIADIFQQQTEKSQPKKSADRRVTI